MKQRVDLPVDDGVDEGMLHAQILDSVVNELYYSYEEMKRELMS